MQLWQNISWIAPAAQYASQRFAFVLRTTTAADALLTAEHPRSSQSVSGTGEICFVKYRRYPSPVVDSSQRSCAPRSPMETPAADYNVHSHRAGR